MEKRLLLFFLICLVILFGWPFLMAKMFPTPPNAGNQAKSQPAATSSPATSSAVPSATATTTPAPQQSSQPILAPQTQTELRTIKVQTEWWNGTISNQGGVLTEWTMTKFTDGKQIDPQTQGVNLISAKASQEFGGTLRFYIPSDVNLEKELNSARYEIKGLTENQLAIGKGQQRELVMTYSNGAGLEVTRKLIFNGDGYNFDFTAEVKRNNQPLPIQIVIGPNFGDQSIKPTEFGIYKLPPRLSYATGDKVRRDMASSVKYTSPVRTEAEHRIEFPVPVTWAAMDDSYFAMALVPATKAQNIHLLNVRRKETIDGSEVERDYLSLAVPVVSGQPSHFYAGPKDIPTLGNISNKFGLGDQDGNLVDILDYGIFSWFAWMFRPLTSFMLRALLWINSFTHNYGWAIVVLTVLINMLFFPLRWKSSVTMKKAAALQPQMKELQERMKKLKKDDPQMLELQREQLELMKQGNILTGCLPLLLQMPFFTAIYLILTVSIEVRKEPFFAWMKDLSSPDPFYLLPVIMCAAMILQTKLTPTPASIDPAQAQAQKMMQYVMPVMLTVFFFIRAPLGLVLYWMVGNIVGVAQQYFINKLTANVVPPPEEGKSGKNSKTELTKGKKSKELLADN